MQAVVPGALKLVRKFRYYVSTKLIEITLGYLLIRVVVQVEIVLQRLQNILSYLFELCVEGMKSDMSLEGCQALERIEITFFPVTFVYFILCK